MTVCKTRAGAGVVVALMSVGCGSNSGGTLPVREAGALDEASARDSAVSTRPETGGSDSSDDNTPAPSRVSACPMGDGGTGDAGTWAEITPPSLNSAKWCAPMWNATCPAPGTTNDAGDLATYGTNAFVIDPSDTATVYLGTSSMGIWKTTDCGATWAHIDTGTNGAEIDTGRNWSMVIDPTNPQVLYTCAGYGPSGVFVSKNGGVDWTQILTGSITSSLPQGGFVEKITMDPTDHEHLVVSFHGACTSSDGGSYGCLAESTNSGNTWSLTNSAAEWSEGDGQTMVNSTTWFYGSVFGGIWRTTNRGGTWTQVYSGDASGSVTIAADGTFYSAGGGGVLHSPDGITWSLIPNSPQGSSVNGSSEIVDDGTTLFSSITVATNTEPADGWYFSAADSDPSTWTSMGGPVMASGGMYLAYDADHHLLYSSNLLGGFWRVVVP